MIAFADGNPAQLHGIAEFTGELWRIDPQSLEASEVCGGFGFQSKLFYDRWRERLVVVDYANQEVVVMGPDCAGARRFRSGHKSYWADVTPRGIYVDSSAGVLRIDATAPPEPR